MLRFLLLLALALHLPTVTAIGHDSDDSFDPREATISSTHHALFTGLTSCRTVVLSFISRIEALNSHTNAIISLSPNSLNIADQLDAQLASTNATFTPGPLFCIPVLLKDNYDTADVPTTGGCEALRDSRPNEDAPAVKALKSAGAIVLGKANLHELALEGISVSSLGGQTINPYDSTRTPGGSSGGSAAAVAASFSVFATGTDTVNSLRSPASANSLFSIRPTRGLISRTGIIPISYTQDVIGPIGRSVYDIATSLTVISSIGYDAADNTTALVPAGIRGTSYAADLESGSLQGLRLGVVEGFFNRNPGPEIDPVNQVMQEMLNSLEAAGAVLVPILDPIFNSSAILASYDTQRFEYRELLTSYLQDPNVQGSHPRSMSELYSTGNKSGNSSGDFLVLPSQYSYVNTALVSSTSNATYAAVQSGISNLTLTLSSTLATHNLSALIYPEQSNLVVPIGSPSQSGRNGILAALTGSPVVTVPAGFSNATGSAPLGVPIGMEILGEKWTEEKLLRIARKIEVMRRVRKTPVWAREEVEVKMYESVPSVVPDRGNIPAVYPLGTLKMFRGDI